MGTWVLIFCLNAQPYCIPATAEFYDVESCQWAATAIKHKWPDFTGICVPKRMGLIS